MDEIWHEGEHRRLADAITEVQTAVGIGKWLTSTILASAIVVIGIMASRGN